MTCAPSLLIFRFPILSFLLYQLKILYILKHHIHISSVNHFQSAKVSLSTMETVELKVEMVGMHEKRLRKCLSKLRGIEKVEVDAYSQKVVVTIAAGYLHRNKLLKAIKRGGLKADFWSPQNELLSAYASASYGSLIRFNNFNF
ncbi:heavy metal-associated isoprenylated plant protein 30-like [Malus sylvestris]|uniref:heavy metal-associated isoprenylated plant protein 30-like n=1 Tax=Malus sylvestris TaxID=3752 RepID=UPI0021ABA75A|nr:heavy metal-associated isoprenylated plant protein 30-like [Malus sylvestris]